MHLGEYLMVKHGLAFPLGDSLMEGFSRIFMVVSSKVSSNWLLLKFVLTYLNFPYACIKRLVSNTCLHEFLLNCLSDSNLQSLIKNTCLHEFLLKLLVFGWWRQETETIKPSTTYITFIANICVLKKWMVIIVSKWLNLIITTPNFRLYI